jgi:tetratricopeptide (TPR) repeat protein
LRADLERLRRGRNSTPREGRARHAGYFLRLAIDLRPKLHGETQRASVERMEQEHDNLRAAIAWYSTAEHAEDHLRLVAAMAMFWKLRGYLVEGRRRLEEALSRPDAAATTPGRAWALRAAGVLAGEQGESETARPLYEESLAITRALGRDDESAHCLNNLGNVAKNCGDLASARAFLEEALSMHRTVGNSTGEAIAVYNLGALAYESGDYDLARSMWETGLRLAREMGDGGAAAENLLGLGEVARELEEYDRARRLGEEALRLAREIRFELVESNCLRTLGLIALDCRDWDAAEGYLGESVRIRARLGNRARVLDCIALLGRVAHKRGVLERAAVLFGAVEAWHPALWFAPAIRQWQENEPERKRLRDQLGEKTFRAAWSTGVTMSFDQAVAFSLGEEPADPLP